MRRVLVAWAVLLLGLPTLALHPDDSTGQFAYDELGFQYDSVPSLVVGGGRQGHTASREEPGDHRGESRGVAVATAAKDAGLSRAAMPSAGSQALEGMAPKQRRRA